MGEVMIGDMNPSGTNATEAELEELTDGSSTALHTHASSVSYTETFQSFSATGSGAWEEIDLSGAPYSVPANAICEIVMKNPKANAELEAGVRNTSSALARLFDLQEAEAGGGDFVSVHVNADANSKIDVYAEDHTEIVFYLVGYWS